MKIRHEYCPSTWKLCDMPHFLKNVLALQALLGAGFKKKCGISRTGCVISHSFLAEIFCDGVQKFGEEVKSEFFDGFAGFISLRRMVFGLTNLGLLIRPYLGTG